MDTDTKNNSKKKFNPENSDDIQKLMTESGEISANQFKVKTANSVYLFGEANEKGERSVSREGKPLKFDRCQVVFLSIGEKMQINIIKNGEPPTPYHTSAVVVIEPSA